MEEKGLGSSRPLRPLYQGGSPVADVWRERTKRTRDDGNLLRKVLFHKSNITCQTPEFLRRECSIYLAFQTHLTKACSFTARIVSTLHLLRRSTLLSHHTQCVVRMKPKSWKSHQAWQLEDSLTSIYFNAM